MTNFAAVVVVDIAYIATDCADYAASPASHKKPATAPG